MELNTPRLQKFRVSILMNKQDEINRKKERVELKYHLKGKTSLNLIENLKYISSPKYLNLFSLNKVTYKTYKNLPKNISNLINDKKRVEQEASRNIKIQTTLTSAIAKKKFKTPFQVIHHRNRQMKDLFNYTKNFCKIPKIENKYNEFINIRTCSTKNNRRLDSFMKSQRSIIGESFDKTKIIQNNRNTISLRKTIKNNKTFNHTFISTTNSSHNNEINEKDNDTSHLKTNENEIDFNMYKCHNKTKIKPIKFFKPNCYYNKLNLRKISTILKKYSYINK